MKPKVYLETTVIGYLRARPSRDIVVAAHQEVTRRWWDTRRGDFALLASQLVLSEASAGDPAAARERLEALDETELLAVSDETRGLAGKLLESGALPKKAAADALHIAIAVTNGADYLLTWNLKHIANAAIRTGIERVCRAAGYEPVVICTPEELFER